MKFFKHFCLLSLILLVCSCKTTQIKHKGKLGVQIPETWSHLQHKKQTTLQPWLADFNIPELNKLINTTLKNNFDLKAAASRMEIAMAIIKRTGADRLPRAGLQLGYSNSKQLGSGDARLTDKASLNANVSWELDIWGKLLSLKRADLENFKASQAEFKAAQLSLAVNVAKLWFNASAKKQQVKLAAKRFESFKNNLLIINDGYEQGILTELDIRLARSDVLRAENVLEVEKELYDRTIRALEVLSGQYPSSELEVPDTFIERIKPVPSGLPSELLSRRPDLIAAEHRLHESENRLEEAEKNWLPDFSLTGQAGNSSGQLIKLLNINSLLFSIAGKLSQTLFSGGRLSAEQDIALARKNERLALYSQAVLKAFQEVETALARETYLNKQKELLAEIKNELLLAEHLSLDQYMEGLIDVIVYLDTQQRTFDAERSFVQINNQRIQNRLELYLALGGDFASENLNPG